ncbi:MAG: hypothetical protein LBP60_07190 [Spirochaetaceae bacterium]|nr:hypothetical protein [Spirochaetaceae bacterium]
MKKVFVGILALFVTVSATAIIAGSLFSPQPFDIDLIQHPHMLSISTQQFPEIKVDYTFSDTKNNYQLRYSLFKQNEGGGEDIRMPFSMYTLPIILNISGEEMNNGNVNRLNDNDVKNEVNGDFGTTVYIERPKSEFGKGYRYIMINFYCKKNHGIVVQSILFNNANFVKSENFNDILHSFKFKD